MQAHRHLQSNIDLEIPFVVKMGILLGNPFSVIAWLFLVIALFALWRFGVVRDNAYWQQSAYRGKLTTCLGTVTDVSDSGFGSSEPMHSPFIISLHFGRGTHHSDHNTDHPVPFYRYQFAFTTPGGHRCTGISYVTVDKKRHQTLPAGVNDHVIIEYPPGRPQLARIHGQRHGLWEAEYLRGLIYYPIFSIIVIGLCIYGSLPRLRRLQRSRVIRAELAHCTQADSKQKGPYFLGTFTFRDEVGHAGKVERRRYDRAWRSDDVLYVFYDAAHPENGRPFADTLTIWCFTIDGLGRITPLSWVGKLAVIQSIIIAVPVMLIILDLLAHG